MTPYPEYKATNLPWLPQIPAHWDWLMLSQLTEEQYVKNIGYQENNVLSLSYGNIIRKKNIYSGLSPQDFATYQIIFPDNIILRLTDLQNDHRSLRTGLVKERGIITSAYTCLKVHSNASFVHYLLHAYDLRKVFYGMGGGVRQSIGFKDIRNLRFPVPPTNEQKQIVRYLDSMTAKINKLIRAKKKQIALKTEILNIYLFSENASCLSLGYWDDLFPDTWHKEKASRIFQERNSKGFADKELLAVTQSKGVLYKKDCPQRFVQPADFTKQKLVCPQDFIISLRSFQGGIETSFLEGLVSAAYSVFCLRKPSLLLTTYFEYLFKTPAFISYLNTLVKDIRDGKKISFTDFRESLLPIPPMEHLEKIKKLSDEINILKKQLEKTTMFLNEYKNSLIASVVTGQVDVRNIPVKEFDPADLVPETDDDPAEEESTEESEE